MPGGLGRARETSVRGVYKVIVRPGRTLTRAALYAARDLVMAAIEDRTYDVDGAVAELRELADSLRLGPSTECIVNAATTATSPPYALAKQTWCNWDTAQRSAASGRPKPTAPVPSPKACRATKTSPNAVSTCGVPVPEGVLVDSAEQAWEAAQDIGLPSWSSRWTATMAAVSFMNLSGRADIETAFSVAADEGSGVLVERFIEGDEHRLLWLGDAWWRPRAATWRQSAATASAPWSN